MKTEEKFVGFGGARLVSPDSAEMDESTKQRDKKSQNNTDN